ncbi:bactofilin family protein [Falsigemmobacter faecalis]|uniref:Polymer-forming cytoskeletal protein n=1 Tax=Falsigemmobacter faecalis TaxID=2488730 RepID=A0A3P3DR97_9RHOB|nr:polymer-forming cytoskeletal protein [Falsigemmobacter faecalis]RRH76681.1 polymer-forming cytoskeletal protein [Falsigemmobacter faecalis]
MFSKSQDERSPAATRGQVSVLASDLIITGVVASEGSIELHGQVDGEMAASVLTVGPDGHMKGRIQAGLVDVLGYVEGAITCSALTLRQSARLKSDVQSPRLIIESGAEVEGRFSRPAPAATAEPAPAPQTSAIPSGETAQETGEDDSLDTPAE